MRLLTARLRPVALALFVKRGLKSVSLISARMPTLESSAVKHTASSEVLLGSQEFHPWASLELLKDEICKNALHELRLLMSSILIKYAGIESLKFKPFMNDS
jgi:hypothetical protein